MKDQEKETDQGVRAYSDAHGGDRVEALLGRTLVSRPPPESLRRQVRRQVAAEWERRPLTLRQQIKGLLRTPVYRRAWGAVAALALVAVVAALVAPSGGPIAGTVMGDVGTVVLAVLFVAIILLVLAYFFFRR